MSKAFTPRRIESLHPWIEATAHRLADGLAADGPFDLLTAFAHQLPSLVISELLGVPAADRDQLTTWSDAVAPLLALEVDDATRAELAAVGGVPRLSRRAARRAPPRARRRSAVGAARRRGQRRAPQPRRAAVARRDALLGRPSHDARSLHQRHGGAADGGRVRRRRAGPRRRGGRRRGVPALRDADALRRPHSDRAGGRRECRDRRVGADPRLPRRRQPRAIPRRSPTSRRVPPRPPRARSRVVRARRPLLHRRLAGARGSADHARDRGRALADVAARAPEPLRWHQRGPFRGLDALPVVAP